MSAGAKAVIKRRIAAAIDYHAEDSEGQQLPVTLVFKRDLDGSIRLFWASELTWTGMDAGQDHRAAGTIEPFWNMFDLLPSGRPHFGEQMQYECCGSSHGAGSGL